MQNKSYELTLTKVWGIIKYWSKNSSSLDCLLRPIVLFVGTLNNDFMTIFQINAVLPNSNVWIECFFTLKGIYIKCQQHTHHWYNNSVSVVIIGALVPLICIPSSAEQ